MAPKNLTVRLDDATRAQLELIAEREVRPMANQIVFFVKSGIANYLKEHGLYFEEIPFDDDGVHYDLCSIPSAPSDEI